MRYLDVVMVRGNGDELRQTLAEPHGDVSLHVDGKRFESFLKATDGKISQAADVLTEIDPADLRQAEGAHWDETCREKNTKIKIRRLQTRKEGKKGIRKDTKKKEKTQNGKEGRKKGRKDTKKERTEDRKEGRKKGKNKEQKEGGKDTRREGKDTE